MASTVPLSDSEKIEQLQRETKLLKEQLQHQTELIEKQLSQSALMQERVEALQDELKRTKLKQTKRAEQSQTERPVYGWRTSMDNSQEPDANTAEPLRRLTTRNPLASLRGIARARRAGDRLSNRKKRFGERLI